METLEKKMTSYKEGKVAKAIEKQTAKLPSDWFLWTGLSSLALSVVFKVMGKDHIGLLVSQLCSPLLLMGIYNKIVKLEGHDRTAKVK